MDYDEDKQFTYDSSNNTNQPSNVSQQPGTNEPYYTFWAEQVKEGNQHQDYQTSKLEIFPDYAYINEPTVQKKPPKGKKIFTFFGVLSLGIVVGICLWVLVDRMDSPENRVGNTSSNTVEITLPPSSAKPNQSVAPNSDNQNNETDESNKANVEIQETKVIPNQSSDTIVADVAEAVMPSIVIINSQVETLNYFGQSENGISSGSGIILRQDNKELLIVTNNHVVSDASEIAVTFNDESIVKASVKGTDSTADLAVITVPLSEIKSETLKAIKVATLGNSDEIKVGEMSIAIGNALGYGQSVTVGYISAKDRTIDMDGFQMSLLQTDAAINPGNSGGALLNTKGEVIGINSIKFASAEVEGMGYAIPITAAVPIINDLMEREVLKEEEKGYLGITGGTVTPEQHESFGIPNGVMVSAVSETGAAKAAGIQVKDVIVKINDFSVTTIESLVERVNSYRVGTTITMTIMRSVDGTFTELKIDVTLKGSGTLKDLEDDLTNQTPVPNENNPGNQLPYDEFDPFGDEWIFPW